MILISHRGNITGGNPERENAPSYIEEAIAQGYNVEIDVWFHENNWYLGHDKPQYKVAEHFFLNNDPLWCHAKNLEALRRLQQLDMNEDVCSFWHENDRYTLTSDGFIWVGPRVLEVNKRCIIVCPEIYPDNFDFTKVAGICSDYISQYNHLK